MNKEEIEDEASERHLHERSREPLFSLPSVVAIVISVSSTFIGVGVLMNKVDGYEDRILFLEQQARTITPGALAAISEIRAVDSSQQAQILDLKSTLRDQRSEILSRLDAIDRKLSEHMDHREAR